MTIGNPAFCLVLYLTRVHFRGELEHVCHAGEKKIKCRPVRIPEIASVRLQDKLCVRVRPGTLKMRPEIQDPRHFFYMGPKTRGPGH